MYTAITCRISSTQPHYTIHYPTNTRLCTPRHTSLKPLFSPTGADRSTVLELDAGGHVNVVARAAPHQHLRQLLLLVALYSSGGEIT